MVAEVYVTVPAEAEYDALVARAETEEQLASLHQLRKEILFDLSELDLALTLGTLIGRGKATPSAIIRYVVLRFLAVVVWIYVAKRKIWITHFETLPATWPLFDEDEFIS